MLHIYLALAEKSRRLLSERIHAMLTARRCKGRFSASAPETLIEYFGDPVQSFMPKPIYWLQTGEAA